MPPQILCESVSRVECYEAGSGWYSHVVVVLHCNSGDDRGKQMYPDLSGPLNKFHTSRTETSHTPTLHTLQHKKSGGLASLCVGLFSPTTTGKNIGGHEHCSRG